MKPLLKEPSEMLELLPDHDRFDFGWDIELRQVQFSVNKEIPVYKLRHKKIASLSLIIICINLITNRIDYTQRIINIK